MATTIVESAFPNIFNPRDCVIKRMFKDLGAGLRNMFGGRSQGYEEELMRARNEAIAEMQQRAEAMGAHAVVGVDIDYEVLGADNGMLMVTASGTAVQIARTA